MGRRSSGLVAICLGMVAGALLAAPLLGWPPLLLERPSAVATLPIRDVPADVDPFRLASEAEASRPPLRVEAPAATTDARDWANRQAEAPQLQALSLPPPSPFADEPPADLRAPRSTARLDLPEIAPPGPLVLGETRAADRPAPREAAGPIAATAASQPRAAAPVGRPDEPIVVAGPPGPPEAAGPVEGDVARAAADPASAPPQADSPPRPRVVIHYTGAAGLDAAEAARRRLDGGDIGPVLLRPVGFRVRRTEIRVFAGAETDRAARVSAALSPRSPVPVVDFRDYRPAPTPGLVEVWLR